MSLKHPSSSAASSLLKQQNKIQSVRASNFHCATFRISAVLQRQLRRPRAGLEGRQEGKNSEAASRPIGHRGVGLSV